MSKYAKQTYKQESHDFRAWPGFEIVIDSIKRAGYPVEYAGKDTVHEYDVVLISITSDCDWWPFIAERAMWRDGKYKVVCGGAGVLNVRPFLSYVHAFVLGRAENVVIDVLKNYESGDCSQSRSVIYSESFDCKKKYVIAQVDRPYPYEIMLTNGRKYRESSIGCPNKCFFCGYTWHRKYYGDGTYKADAKLLSSGNRERTIIDLLKLPPKQWQDEGPLRIVGLDGMSERLRYKANKRISRDMLRNFFLGLAEIEKPHQVKLYVIVGYPTETFEDYKEFIEDLNDVDRVLKKNKQWSLLVHFTPFRAMPATPAATWQMSRTNYRGLIARKLKNPSMTGNVFFQGNRFWAVEGIGTDSLPTVILSALCLRGIEKDAGIMRRIAITKKFWTSSSSDRLRLLDSCVDVERLMKAYSQEELPTNYLKTYLDFEKYGQ